MHARRARQGSLSVTPPPLPHSSHYEIVGDRVRNAIKALEKRRREYFGHYTDAPWDVTMRVKDRASIDAKVERKRRQGKPDYSLADLTDIVGVRVVVEGRACAAHVAELVRGWFPVHEEDCETFLDKPRDDGYRGIHLALNVESEGLPTAIPVELQIRTILQHQWSVLSHSEFYKHLADIPPSMLLRMRALSETLNCAEIESDQLRRGRISDECAWTLRELLHETIERLAAGPADAGVTGTLGLHLLEFDRKLRRTLISTGDRERRAFGALESLAELGEIPGADPEVAARLAEIVRRVRIVVRPCHPG